MRDALARSITLSQNGYGRVAPSHVAPASVPPVNTNPALFFRCILTQCLFSCMYSSGAYYPGRYFSGAYSSGAFCPGEYFPGVYYHGWYFPGTIGPTNTTPAKTCIVVPAHIALVAAGLQRPVVAADVFNCITGRSFAAGVRIGSAGVLSILVTTRLTTIRGHTRVVASSVNGRSRAAPAECFRWRLVMVQLQYRFGFWKPRRELGIGKIRDYVAPREYSCVGRDFVCFHYRLVSRRVERGFTTYFFVKNIKN